MSWRYQLQNVDPVEFGDEYADYKVTDPFNDKEAVRWSVADVQIMRGDPHTKLLAYLSIGEAETYRPYWQKSWLMGDKPLWLDDENPDWPGNYKVEFWNGEWKQIIFKEVDAIIDQGFDGLYLDIIDAFEYFEDKGVHDAGHRMVRFVIEIAEHARKRRPGFLIFPQNGEALLEFPSYVNTISGIGVEDVVYGAEEDGEKNEVGHTAERCDDLRLLGDKPILLVEYGLGPKRRDFTVGALDAFRIPTNHLLFTDRSLD
jgi:cysteinyl-tRNA synthetase